jgi:hypothetical protein
MRALVHAADIQDRDGRAADGDLVRRLPFLATLYADGGYQRPEFRAAMKPNSGLTSPRPPIVSKGISETSRHASGPAFAESQHRRIRPSHKPKH